MDFTGIEGGEPRVVYEDASLVAVYKPPRMHSAPGLGELDLCAWTFERFPAARLGGAGRKPAEGGLLHRLDYETSGLVLFALEAGAFAGLLEQQGRGLFCKEYLALSTVSSSPQPEGSRPAEGLPSGVDGWLWAAARRRLDAGALSALLEAGRREGASPARISSDFRPFGLRGSRVACLGEAGAKEGSPPLYDSEVLDAAHRPGAGKAWALELRLRISRGFRHQIRAQLAWIGLPIAGDPLYGGGPDGRLRLYAVALDFTHPLSGKPQRIAIL